MQDSMAANQHHEHAMAFPVLIGDIGGTNARFSLLLDSYAEPKTFPIVRTAEFETIDDAIQRCILDHTSVQPRSALLAIAGPIQGDELPLTNCPWVVKPRDMIANLGFEDVTIINDFEAQALAVASLRDTDREQIGGNGEERIATRVVLGPGTGLGVAGVVYSQHRWIPVPGEGGHVDLGPRTDRDYQIFPHVEKIGGRVSGEQILCGRGIVNLYKAICAADGVEPKLGEPATVSEKGLDGSDPQAKETLSLFATYLGRVAGDLALTFMAKGGVFISGGIPQKIMPALKAGGFRAAFEDKAPHNKAMAGIATYVVTHPLAALAGLAAYARAPGGFSVATEGRRWHR
jgi:glucokinase